MILVQVTTVFYQRHSVVVLVVVNLVIGIHVTGDPARWPFHVQALTIPVVPGRFILLSLRPLSARAEAQPATWFPRPAVSTVQVHIWDRDLYRQALVNRAAFTLSLRLLRVLGLAAALAPLALYALMLWLSYLISAIAQLASSSACPAAHAAWRPSETGCRIAWCAVSHVGYHRPVMPLPSRLPARNGTPVHHPAGVRCSMSAPFPPEMYQLRMRRCCSGYRHHPASWHH
jgi:hypothetical protein